MEIIFTKDYLKELYLQGFTNDKKHRFQPPVIKGYQKAINYLIVARCVEDLLPFHSLHYETLSGDKKGISSVRINDKYRVEFIVEHKENETTVTVCSILEISNHYQ